jgi:hypothetical protein
VFLRVRTAKQLVVPSTVLVLLSMLLFLMYERFQALACGHLHALAMVQFGGVMKSRLLNLIKKAVAPVALFAALAAFNPGTVMAANRGGGGHSYAAPSRGNFGGGHSFTERGNVRENFNRGYGARDIRGGYYGGRGYGPGFGFGVGVYPAYGSAGPVCRPAGFYDPYGVWHFYPGCAGPY